MAWSEVPDHAPERPDRGGEHGYSCPTESNSPPHLPLLLPLRSALLTPYSVALLMREAVAVSDAAAGLLYNRCFKRTAREPLT